MFCFLGIFYKKDEENARFYKLEICANHCFLEQ